MSGGLRWAAMSVQESSYQLAIHRKYVQFFVSGIQSYIHVLDITALVVLTLEITGKPREKQPLDARTSFELCSKKLEIRGFYMKCRQFLVKNPHISKILRRFFWFYQPRDARFLRYAVF